MKYAPREYQKHAIKKLVAESEFGLFMRPGLGKTSVTLAAFKLLRDRGLVGSMLVIAPKRICYHVWPNELKKWDDFRGLTYRILHGKTRSLGAEADIYLINPEGLGWLMVELAQTKQWPFEWLVIDECFPASTIVTTPTGDRAIETIVAGDTITTSDGPRVVTRTACRSATELVELTLSNGATLRCTPEHPVFTARGWMTARVTNGETLYAETDLSDLQDIVRGAVRDDTARWQTEMLLAILRSETGVGGVLSATACNNIECHEEYVHGQTIMEQEPCMVGGTPREGLGERQSEGLHVHSARRQRTRTDGTRDDVDDGIAGDVYLELRHKLGSTAAWLSYKLQSRLRRSGEETGDRGGWCESSQWQSTGVGSKESSQVGRPRVVSVTRVEQGRTTDVYNLQIDGCPHFFANGVLVHNSTRFKHTNTQRFKLLKNVLHRFMRRTILTGTPTPNGMLDLFGQIMVMDMGKSLGKFITHYRNDFFEQSGYMGYEWKLKPDGEQRILNRIRHNTLSLSDEDLLELPERVDIVVDVALPEDALKKYRELERELVLELESDTVTAASAGVAAMKCRQLANGGIYLPTPPGMKRKWEHVHEAKLDALEEIVEELQGAPALVAYEFEHDLDRLRGRFGKTTPALHGGMKEHEVGEIIARWNRGEIPLLFVQPQTSALGLNLQESGSTIVWFGLVWDLEIYDQLVKRIWRSGQRAAHVYVHHLVATDTVDEVILKALRSKDTGQRKLMDALKVHMKNKWRQAVTKAA